MIAAERFFWERLSGKPKICNNMKKKYISDFYFKAVFSCPLHLSIPVYKPDSDRPF